MTFFNIHAGLRQSMLGFICFNPASDIKGHMCRLVPWCWKQLGRPQGILLDNVIIR